MILKNKLILFPKILNPNAIQLKSAYYATLVGLKGNHQIVNITRIYWFYCIKKQKRPACVQNISFQLYEI